MVTSSVPVPDLLNQSEAQTSNCASASQLLENVKHQDGPELSELQAYKDEVELFARYHDFVTEFERLAVLRLQYLPDYCAAVKESMQPLHSVEAALAFLAQLSFVRDLPQDDETSQFLRANSKLEAFWYQAVNKAGLSKEGYEKVRDFVKASNQTFHQKVSAREALLELQRLPVPATCSQFKTHLEKMLTVLADVLGTGVIDFILTGYVDWPCC